MLLRITKGKYKFVYAGVDYLKTYTILPEGRHQVYTTAKGQPFGGFIYGTAAGESYGARLANVDVSRTNRMGHL